jgi:hypothetical protein
LLLLGVLGPMVTGIWFTYLTRDRAGRRDYWARVIDVKRIRWTGRNMGAKPGECGI